ncbi:MAG: tyrosine recombinase [bacterium]
MVKQHLNDFLAHLRLERGLSVNTIEAYGRDLCQFREISHLTGVAQLNRKSIQRYLDWLCSARFKPATVARKLSCLRQFTEYLVQKRVVGDKPTAALNAPRIARYHPHYLSPEEIKSMIESIDLTARNGRRDRAALELMYGCGLRIAEVGSLRYSDIEFEAGFIRVTGKGDKQRLVPLGAYAAEALESLKESRDSSGSSSDYVFMGPRDHPLSRVSLWKIVKKAALAAALGKPVTPHTLRHSFATHLLAGGADLRVVQEMLGHADISTTQIYTTIDQDYIVAEHRKYHPRELARTRQSE